MNRKITMTSFNPMNKETTRNKENTDEQRVRYIMKKENTVIKDNVMNKENTYCEQREH